jgi:protein pelota
MVVHMRVLKKNLRGDEGEITLLPESLDDLWHLQHLVARGDLVFALTHRKVAAIADKMRPEKMERKTVRLGIKVEDIEFHIYSNWLRLHGVIKSGMDVGAYHTLNIEVGTDLSILKYHWRPDTLQRIDDAVAESLRPRVVLALVEEGEATIGVLRQFGVQMAAELRMGSGKGCGMDTRAEFFRDVAAAINQTAGEGAQVILAGPGFTKEDLKKVIDSSYPDLAERIAMDDASSIGRSGFQEVLRRGAVKSVLESSRIAKEAKLIEDLFREIATDGKAAYGIKEVQTAVNYGAVEHLLVLDEMARRGRLDEIMREVGNARGKVVIFSSEFEPGERLRSLGGVAALLRFKISSSSPDR